jgi:hypothetical protein
MNEGETLETLQPSRDNLSRGYKNTIEKRRLEFFKSKLFTYNWPEFD